jgi:pilus assembly protein Flp/PilA
VVVKTPSYTVGAERMGTNSGKIMRFLTDEGGPTAVEYAVMLALILVACITIVTSLGKTVSGTFSKVNTTLSS